MTQERRRTKRVRKTATCPDCGSTEVLPIVHGIPTSAQNKAIQKGEAVQANREEWEGMTEWYCKRCGCDWSGNWRRFKKPAHSDERTTTVGTTVSQPHSSRFKVK
jgi:hypothetical protein